jgi:hypothetical protein
VEYAVDALDGAGDFIDVRDVPFDDRNVPPFACCSDVLRPRYLVEDDDFSRVSVDEAVDEV